MSLRFAGHMMRRSRVVMDALTTPLTLLGSKLVFWSDLSAYTLSVPGLTAPSDFSNGAWTKTSVTVSGTTIITASAGAGNHRVEQSATNFVTPTYLTGATVFSIKAKYINNARVFLGTGTSYGSHFNVQTGTFVSNVSSASGSISGPDANGFYTLSVTDTAGGFPAATFRPHMADGAGSLSWTAAGTEQVEMKEATVTQNRISQLDDLSGYGNHVTQSTIANQPCLAAVNVFSRPAVSCNNTAPTLFLRNSGAAAGIASGDYGSVFSVLRWRVSSVGGNQSAVALYDGGGQNVQMGAAAASLWRGIRPGFSATAGTLDTTAHLGREEQNESTTRLVLDSTALDTNGGRGSFTSSASGSVVVGAGSTGGADGATADIAEVVCAKNLTTAEITSLVSYFSGRYGQAWSY